MDFPDPNKVPQRRYRAERFVSPDGSIQMRYFEDPEFDVELENLLFEYLTTPLREDRDA